jgi:aminoglycoside phosphotransferase (APT) family kinase protein
MLLSKSARRANHLSEADWRFVLPGNTGGFRHVVLLGGTPELAHQLVQIGYAKKISTKLPGARTADAVAALAGHQTNASELLGCLRPGGLLYYEGQQKLSSLHASGLDAALRAVQSAGGCIFGAYAIRPNVRRSRTRHYLPVDLPTAIDWYLDVLHKPSSTSAWLLHRFMRLFPRLHRRGFLAATRYFAVTATAGPAPEMMKFLPEHPALPPALRGREIRSLLLTDTGNRVVQLPFAPGRTQPMAVLKIPKLSCFDDRTVNEHQKLVHFASSLSDNLKTAIPQPLALLRNHELCVAVESYLPGRALLRSSSPRWMKIRTTIADLQLAARWLGEFHSETRVELRSWGEPDMVQWVNEPAARFHKMFGTAAAEERLFSNLRVYAESLSALPFPLVWMHRDYRPGNVMRSEKGAAVIDWEGARPGPPLCDLIHFVSRWYGAVRPKRPAGAKLERFRKLWIRCPPSDVHIRAGRAVIRDYCEKVGVDHRFVPLLVVYTFVELALRRAEQQRLQGSLGNDARAGNENASNVKVLGFHSDELFSRTLEPGWLR